MLADKGVKAPGVHGLICKNTYVCFYPDVNLYRIRRIKPIVYVDICRKQFKLSPDLWESPLDRNIRLDVIFHYGVDPIPEDFKALVAMKSGANREDISFYRGGAQLVARGARIEDLGAINRVRPIEEKLDIKLCNDQARIVLGCYDEKQVESAESTAFQGDGQIIAVADTRRPGSV